MTTYVLETLKAEIYEAVELQRTHFPDDEITLRHRAEEKGQWPDFAEVAKEEAAKRAAEAAALAALEAADAAEAASS